MKRSIFVVISIIFLNLMIFFYGGRLIYYYNTEHKNNSHTTLYNHIIASSNNLINIDNNMYFKADSLNNFVYFNGLKYRIVYLNEKYLTLITDEVITKLKFGNSNDYNTSDIAIWLNDKYKYTLDNSYLYNDKISLLSKNIFININKKSYINTDDIWILDNNQTFILNENGEINKSDNYDEFLGVKPIIRIKNINYISGTGIELDPYIIKINSHDTIKDCYIGQYIKYKSRIYRIIDINNNGVKVVSIESITNRSYSKYSNVYGTKYMSNLGYYLNNIFIKELNKDDLVLTNWHVSKYEDSYINNEYIDVKNYIGLLSIGDYFVSDIEGYILNYNNKNIYTIKDNYLYLTNIESTNKVYPAFVLKNTLKIKGGMGTYEMPYELGD